MSPAVCFASSDAVPGHAVLAQPGGDALIIWNASPVVAPIVRSKMSGADADALLERDAIRALAKIFPNIDKSASSITVRIIYALSGEVSPLYGNPTFKGFEQYALLNIRGRDARAERARWDDLADKAQVPSIFTLKIVGRLPPRI